MKRLDNFRDVLLLQGDALCLVTAVDSCGSIGEKENDALNSPPETVGYFTARTVLLEVMATGAAPAFATISVCNEPETAARLLAGVKTAFDGFGDIPWVMSTEKNMPTKMTALGISLTGACDGSLLRLARSRAGDVLCCAGLPLVGAEVSAAEASLFDIKHMEKLLANPLVSSILPVGSRGIAAEAAVLAGESGLEAALDLNCGIDFYKSAGPSSCVLFTASPEVCISDVPYAIIGKLN
jgi:hypothetical protein